MNLRRFALAAGLSVARRAGAAATDPGERPSGGATGDRPPDEPAREPALRQESADCNAAVSDGS